MGVARNVWMVSGLLALLGAGPVAASVATDCNVLSQGHTFNQTDAVLRTGDVLYAPTTVSAVGATQAPPLWGIRNLDTGVLVAPPLSQRHYTIPSDGTYQIIALNGFDPAPILCTPAQVQIGHSLMQSQRALHTSSLGSALAGAAALRGGAPAGTGAVSQNGLFWSPPEAGQGPTNLWLQLSTSQINGPEDGTALNLHLGADQAVSGGYLGLALSHSRVTQDSPSGREEAVHTALSPYFGLHNEGLSLSGHISLGRVEHQLTGATVTGRAFGLGLRAQLEAPLAAVTLQPFIALQASREDLPDYTVGGTLVAAHRQEHSAVQLGVRITTPVTSNGLRAYGSLALERGRNDTTYAAPESFTAPRVVLGLQTGDSGRGNAQLELEYGHHSADSTDLTMRGGFTFAF